mmetsp:Transcript_40162/g.126370  ORF Transcript_40162/g.126370 Transcript_40162/m.126370 type:complete len:408 (-) Transcript_40162:930-2153(-)
MLQPLPRLPVPKLPLCSCLQVAKLLLLHLRSSGSEELLLDLDHLHLLAQLLVLLYPRLPLHLDLLLQLQLGFVAHSQPQLLLLFCLLQLPHPLLLGILLADLTDLMDRLDSCDEIFFSRLLGQDDFLPPLLLLLLRLLLHHLQSLQQLCHRHCLQHMPRALAHARRIELYSPVHRHTLESTDLPHDLHPLLLLLGSLCLGLLLESLRLFSQFDAEHRLRFQHSLYRRSDVLLCSLHVVYQQTLLLQQLLPLSPRHRSERLRLLPHVRSELLILPLVLNPCFLGVLVGQDHLDPPLLDLLQPPQLVLLSHPRLPLVVLAVVSQFALVLLNQRCFFLLLLPEQRVFSQYRRRVEPDGGVLGRLESRLRVCGLRRNESRLFFQQLLMFLSQSILVLARTYHLLRRELLNL